MEKNINMIYDKLKNLFGDASCELNFTNNFQLLIAVILSARCTDKRVNIITDELFKKYKTPYDFANAKLEDIEKEIYSCGFYKNKAKNIVNASKDILDKYNGQVPDEFDELVKLSGVGRKTANVVLSVGYKQDALAVDTHVFRVSNRLGIVKAKTPFECENQLKTIVDKNKWSKIHHYLVLYGRYYCKSQNPKCKNCILKNYCDYFKYEV